MFEDSYFFISKNKPFAGAEERSTRTKVDVFFFFFSCNSIFIIFFILKITKMS